MARELLTAVASLVGEQGLKGVWAPGVGAPRLSCSEARGALLGQGLNLRPLHWAGVSFTTEPPRQPGVRLLKAELHKG